ncbi:hypothetical protein ISCGN_028202 [Ixodes scapularis]
MRNFWETNECILENSGFIGSQFENPCFRAHDEHAPRQISEVRTLQKAKAAVGSIKSDALSEIRSLRAPPDVIRDILEGVLRLMGIFDTSWVSMKSFLAKRGVKEEILGFDVRSVTPEIRQSVQELLVKNQSSFDVKNAKRASAAAAPLASWVQANVKYAEVLQKIGPLEAEQAKLKKNLSTAERRMDKLGSALEDVDQEVSRLRDRLNQFTKEAAQIEINLRSADETIGTAEEMVLQLEGEYQRWTKQARPTSSPRGGSLLSFFPLKVSPDAMLMNIHCACFYARRQCFPAW